MKQYFKYIYFLLFITISTPLMSQQLLFAEDFNECALPEGWVANVSYGDDTGFYIGQPVNDNSDSTSIDGSCMMVFDDDILGNNTPSFVAEAISPVFSTQGYNTVRLRTDVSFRQYGTSTFSVYIEEVGGQRMLLAEYSEGQQTGAQFSDFATLSLDLSFFTESEELRLVYIYDDKEMYAWYAGIDNIEVIGSGEGEIILIEQFNDCVMPEGWATEILEGEEDWVFGLFTNEKSNATSMNSTCFAFFDDDLIGRDAPYSTADLKTPWFDGAQYATFTLEMELIFRRYGDFENISVYVNDGEEIKLVKEFFDAVGGPQITNYMPIQLDLTPYRSNTMQVIFRYDDGNEWGWWTGLDNVKIIGHGTINDLCDNFEMLEIGKACISSDNTNAVFSGPSNTCFENGEGSLWYALNAPQDGIVEIVNKADYNDLITVYTGSCDALEELVCENSDEHGFRGEKLVVDVKKDSIYYVRISGIDSKFGLSRGSNCISATYIDQAPTAVPEDIQAMAVELVINDPTQDVDNSHSGIEAVMPEGNLLARSDIWYTFTTDTAVHVKVDVMAEFAENTVVYDGEMKEIHAQLEGGSFALLNLEANTKYYLQMSGTFAIVEGRAAVRLSTFEMAEPESDDCDSYSALVLDEEIVFDNAPQTFSGAYSSCDIYSTKDRWFSFVASANVHYLNVESDFVANATVYTGGCEALEELYCESGMEACKGSMNLAGLEIGQRYWVQISTSETNNNNVSSTAKISLSSEPVVPPQLSLNVWVQCLENGFSELQIVVDSEVPYTLEGNAHGEMLFEGDEYLVVAHPEGGCEQSIKGIVDCQGTSCNLMVESALSFPSCHGELDGSLSLEIENGLGPYSYQWSHTEVDIGGFESLGAGQYHVTVTDALGCVFQETIELLEPNELEWTFDWTDQQTANQEDGSAAVTVAGGTKPYKIDWSNGMSGTEVDGLAPDNYAVTITDHNGCDFRIDFTIAELDCAFSVDSELESVSCPGGNDGSIQLSLDQNVLSIEWDNEDAGAELTNLEAGTYMAQIVLENGCEKTEVYTITQPEEIAFNGAIENVSCFGLSDGSIDTDVTGGNGGFGYLWEDGNIETERTELPAGMYTLVVTDNLGCTAEEVFEITSPEVLEVASSMVSDLTCWDSNDGQACVFVEGGTMPYQFDWEGLENGMSKMENLSAGTYRLIVTDANQCTLEVEQTIESPAALSVTLIDLSISESDNGTITIDVDGGVEPYEVTWYLNGDVVGMGESISGLEEGIYSALIMDGNGCTMDSPEYLLSLTSTAEIDPGQYTLFPNPTQSAFRIESAQVVAGLDLKVVTSTGQDVSHLVAFDFESSSISGRNKGLNTGLYFVEIIRQNQELIQRIPLLILGSDQ